MKQQESAARTQAIALNYRTTNERDTVYRWKIFTDFNKIPLENDAIAHLKYHPDQSVNSESFKTENGGFENKSDIRQRFVFLPGSWQLYCIRDDNIPHCSEQFYIHSVFRANLFILGPACSAILLTYKTKLLFLPRGCISNYLFIPKVEDIYIHDEALFYLTNTDLCWLGNWGNLNVRPAVSLLLGGDG